MNEAATSTRGGPGASFARGTLHAVAGIGAALVTIGFALWLGGVDPGSAAPMLIATVAASQIAAAAGWPLIDRWLASDWIAPLGVGIAMALIVHLAAGFLWVLVWTLIEFARGEASSGIGATLDFVAYAVFYSALFVGWITAPTAMAAAVAVNRLRRKERRAGSAA